MGKNINDHSANEIQITERSGAVVTHWTRIREVLGSNPGADQSDFVVFLRQQGKCWVRFSLPQSIGPLFIKFTNHKIKAVNLTKKFKNSTKLSPNVP